MKAWERGKCSRLWNSICKIQEARKSIRKGMVSDETSEGSRGPLHGHSLLAGL